MVILFAFGNQRQIEGFQFRLKNLIQISKFIKRNCSPINDSGFTRQTLVEYRDVAFEFRLCFGFSLPYLTTHRCPMTFMNNDHIKL